MLTHLVHLWSLLVGMLGDHSAGTGGCAKQTSTRSEREKERKRERERERENNICMTQSDMIHTSILEASSGLA